MAPFTSPIAMFEAAQGLLSDSSGPRVLVTPAVEERVRDLVFPADVLHRPIAAQHHPHARDLLLRRPPALPPRPAQPNRLLVPAAHPDPAARQSLRRHAPPRLPGAPTQLPANTGPGSGTRQPLARAHRAPSPVERGDIFVLWAADRRSS